MTSNAESLPVTLHRQNEAWRMLGCPNLLGELIERAGTFYPGAKRPKGMRKGRAKGCFENAGKLVMNSVDWKYVEGYAISERLGILIHHAWCLDENGIVVDSTWKDPQHCQYMGIPFSDAQLCQQLVKNGVWGVFDIGYGFNVKLMREICPEIEPVIDTLLERSFRS